MLTIAHVLMIWMMGMFLKGSWEQTLINWDNMAPASGLSLGILYTIGIIFSTIAILVLFGDLVLVVSGKLSHTISSEAEEALAEVAHNDAHQG